LLRAPRVPQPKARLVLSLGYDHTSVVGFWVGARHQFFTVPTARKVGSDGRIRVYIGCGHPIQTWARATK
jgi:hypothetical protein